MGVDIPGDLELLRGRELRAEAAAQRLAREARAVSRSSRGGGSLLTAVGTGLMRAGLWLGGEAPVSGTGRGPARPVSLMARPTASVLLPAIGRRRPRTGVAASAARSQSLAEFRPAGGVRAWFARGQLGPAPGVEDVRGTAARC